jgi:hypothetical protein
MDPDRASAEEIAERETPLRRHMFWGGMVGAGYGLAQAVRDGERVGGALLEVGVGLVSAGWLLASLGGCGAASSNRCASRAARSHRGTRRLTSASSTRLTWPHLQRGTNCESRVGPVAPQ